MFRKWLKTREAAEFLGVSVSALEKWRQRGQGPQYSQTGPRTIRYHVDALTAHQAQNSVVPGQ